MSERSLFLAALDIDDPSERSAYLDQVCAGAPALRAQVEQLLKAHQEPGSFMERPAIALGAAVDDPIRERPGTIIGPYKLMEQIGEGGMGLVFVAEQQQPVRRKVALKVIKPGMDTRQVVARFEAERQALALMDHPNIAKVLDAGTTASERPYFVMELVKGVPITEYCDQNQVPIRQRLELFMSVCQAVQHAHQKGIIHRDLKPGNVLVMSHDGTPVVKVIDFGVAKAIDQELTDKTIYTQFSQLVGTPLYMSPEQAGQSGLDVDTRSDIYSLGVLLYELLTGTTPFEKERLRTVGFDEMRRIIREEEPPKPSTRISTLGQVASTVCTNRHSDPKQLSRLFRGELDWIVMKALEKDRNRRYETASAFAVDVKRYLLDEPVQACPPSARYRLGKMVRRHKGRVMAAAVMIGLLLAGTAVSIWQAVRATHAEQQERKALDQMTAAQGQTRQALDTLTDDVVENLFAKQTELGDTEKGFLRKVLGFYETFTQQSGETAEARILQAQGYYKVAHLRAALGEHRAAEAAYRQSEVLLEQLAAEFPDEALYRHKLARTEGNLGIELAKLRKQAEAETAFRRGIRLRTALVEQFPNDLSYPLELANNYNDLGFLYELQQNYPEAEAAYRQSLDMKEKLVAKAGDVARHHLDLAHTLAVMGQLWRKQGKFAESEKAFRQALNTQKEQMGKASATAKDRQQLANSYMGLGIALAELKREEEAGTAIRQAVDIRKKLSDDFPNVLEYRVELANGCSSLGYFFSRQKKNAEAEETYRQALELRKKIVAQAGPVPGYRLELAQSYHDVAYILSVTDRAKEAEATWQAALEIWKQLVADLPPVPDFHDGLAGTLCNLAVLRNKHREFDAAVVLLEQARPHFQTALKTKPKDAAIRSNYRDYLEALAQSRQGQANHDQLAAIAEELARFGYEPAKDTYLAASFLCRCMTLADRDKQLADARRRELVRSYSDRALALLRQAVEGGFKNAARMKQDRDLDPLRARNEFRKLLADVESKTKD